MNFRRASPVPFLYFVPSVRSEAFLLIFVLLPHIFLLAFTKSFASLNLIAVSIFASVLADFFDGEKMIRDPFFWTSSIFRGLVSALFLPSLYPPTMAFFVVFAAMFLNRAVLGGFANSWANPVAIAVAVAWLLGFGYFPENPISQKILSMKNPSLSLINDGTIPLLSSDARITAFLNEKIFSHLGVSIPAGYISLLWDSSSPIPAFRFNVLTLFASAVIFSVGTAGKIVPVVSTVVYVFFARFVLPLFVGESFGTGDILLAIFTGGFLFGTTFLLQWHGTVPLTKRGKVCYGFLAGLLEAAFLGFGMSAVGFIFVILILNVFSPLIQAVENRFGNFYGAENVSSRSV